MEKNCCLCKARRVSDKQFVIGYYANCSYPGHEEDTEQRTGHFIIEYPNTYHEIYPFSICSFTGLCDKNGRKLFEGDLVRLDCQICVGDKSINTVCTAVCIWEDFSWKLKLQEGYKISLSESLCFEVCETLEDLAIAKRAEAQKHKANQSPVFFQKKQDQDNTDLEALDDL